MSDEYDEEARRLLADPAPVAPAEDEYDAEARTLLEATPDDSEEAASPEEVEEQLARVGPGPLSEGFRSRMAVGSQPTRGVVRELKRRIDDIEVVERAKVAARAQRARYQDTEVPEAAMRDPEAARAFLKTEEAEQERMTSGAAGVGLQVVRGAQSLSRGVFGGLLDLIDTKDAAFEQAEETQRRKEGWVAKGLHGAAEVGGALAPIGLGSKVVGAGARAVGIGERAAGYVASSGAVSAYSGVQAAARGENVPKAMVMGAGLGVAGHGLSDKIGQALRTRFPEAAGWKIGAATEAIANLPTGVAVHGIEPGAAGWDALVGAIVGGVGGRKGFAAKSAEQIKADVAQAVETHLAGAEAPSTKPQDREIEAPPTPDTSGNRGFAADAETGRPFEADLFRASVKGRANPETGAFLGPKDVAEDARVGQGPGSKVEPRHVRFDNPLVIESKAEWLREKAAGGDRQAEMLLEASPKFGARQVKVGRQAAAAVERMIAAEAREAGHDGIVNRGEQEVQDIGPPARPRAHAVVGAETQIPVGKGPAVRARYALMEADALLPSHDPATGFSWSKNYPRGLQERDYETSPASQEKVERIARDLDPAEVLANIPGATAGPPVVTPDATVVNGNGRAMGIKRAGPEAMARYVAELRARAAGFGLDPAALDGMRRPVLVRVVEMDPRGAEAAAFGRRGNVVATESLSPLRRASRVAELTDDRLLGPLAVDADLTLSEAVMDPVRGREFRRALESALEPTERAEFFKLDGGLTEAGKELAEGVLLAKAIRDPALIEALSPQMRRTLSQSAVQLAQIGRDPGMRDVMEAFRDGIQGAVRGETGGGRLFGTGLSDAAQVAADFLATQAGHPKKMRDALARLVEQARSERGGLLGEPEPIADTMRRALGGKALAEAGFIDAGSIATRLGEAGSAAVRGLRAVFGSMTGSFEGVRGEAARTIREKAPFIEDDTKGYAGRLRDAGAVRALNLASGKGPVRALAARRLSGYEERDGYLASRWREALEERGDARPGVEQEMVRGAWEAQNERGKIAEEVGLQQTRWVTGPDGERIEVVVPFVNKGGRIALRLPTPEYIDALTRGRGDEEMWGAIENAYVKASGMTPEEAREFVKRVSDEYSDDGPEGAVRRVGMEIGRELDRVPDAVRLPNGRILPLYEHRPFEYIGSVVERGAARLAVVRHMGQDIGNDRPLDDLRRLFVAETSMSRPFIRQFKALHGVSPDRPILRPGTLEADVTRTLNAALGVAKSGMMSMSAIPNLFETLGPVREIAGTRAYLGALARYANAVGRKALGKENLIDAMNLAGETTKNVLSLALDPNRPLESGFRAIAGISNRANASHFVNEANEHIAGIAARIAVKQMRAGTRFGENVIQARAVGFSHPDAVRMATGRGTEAEYGGFVKRQVARTVGSTELRSERSPFQNNRVARSLVWFTTYPWTQMRRLGSYSKAYLTAMKQSVTDPNLTEAQRWKIRLGGTKQLMGATLGRVAAGSASLLAASWVYSGFSWERGVEPWLEEMQERPVGFMFDSWLSTVAAGPLGGVIGAIEGRRDAEDMVGPVWVGKQIFNVVTGNGPYENLPAGQKWEKFLRRMVPATTAFENATAIYLHGSPETSHLIENAKRHLWRFQKRQPDDDANLWSTQMRGAYAALFERGAGPAEAAAFIAEALKVDGKDADAVRASLRARRLLHSLSAEEKEATRKGVGEENYRLLQLHDDTLTRAAESGNRPKREERARREGRPGRGDVNPFTAERLEEAAPRR